MREFNRYLRRYGWRLETWDELSKPTWQESPALAIRVIEYYLAAETESPHAPLVRSARRRRNEAQRAASQLASQPDKLARFKTALAMARQYVPVREGRAFWQLTLGGSLRPVCLALGEKLRDVGVLEQATDVFYLRLEELHQIAEGACENDWREVAKRRQVEHEYWTHMEPPPAVGAAPGALVAALSPTEVEEGTEKVLRGTPAGAGIAEGRAKVLLSLNDADKIQRGEILVCRTTSPAWSHLFSRIGGVVADAGSVLGHCAIVAREYAIPWVVGVRGGNGTNSRRHDDYCGWRARDRPDSVRRLTASGRNCALNILWLGDPDCHDPSLVGGKAPNLSRVATAHPVPPGFCLTTSAFDQATGGGEMTGAAMAVPSSVTPLLYAQLTSAYQLLAELCHLPEPSVAVRASAVGEDSSTASFAGQHDTYLNVKGVEAVAQAVVGCWQSVSSSLAEEYRRQQGLSQDPPRIAVLVQRLVSADLSAVVFSANPVTGNSNEVVINANWGLGESVVGGTVTPDTYVISKVDFTVTSQDISQKDRMTVLVPGGTQEADVPLALQNLASADQTQALEMARLAVELERTMGWPVDVECAYEDGRLYLLQCRPITTL